MFGHSSSTTVWPQPPPAPGAATVISIHELKAHCGSCNVRELCLPFGLEP